MSDRLDWGRDGTDWPNREASRFVTAGGLRWHVQQMGAGPPVLLLHGTGASTHSWRDLAPLLARHFSVTAMDLPGHGFTEQPPLQLMSLPAMAEQLGSLVAALVAGPHLAIGHSAGAAILARMTLDGRIAPQGVVSLNGALVPMQGLPARVFTPLARLFAANSIAPRLFAWHAEDPAVVHRLLRETGSRIDRRGIELYARLAGNPGHVGAALAMMASWELLPLARDLPRLAAKLFLVAGSNDRTIPSSQAYELHARMPAASVIRLPGLGHLAHEEQPERVAELIVDLARSLDASGESSLVQIDK
jgi:magnesium chelatase accessory protein